MILATLKPIVGAVIVSLGSQEEVERHLFLQLPTLQDALAQMVLDLGAGLAAVSGVVLWAFGATGPADVNSIVFCLKLHTLWEVENVEKNF